MQIKWHSGICAFLFICVNAKGQTKEVLLKSYMDAATHHEALNENKQAYEAAQKANTLLLSIPGISPEKLGSIQSDLGTYAYRMGDVKLASSHHHKAIKIFQSLTHPDYRHLYLSGNNMGSIMWMASKIDSSLFYFNIALRAIEKMEPTPENNYYRTAVLQNNLAGIYGAQGKTTEGIRAMKTTIENLRLFLAVKEPQSKRDNALHFQFEATDNLAGIYKELGNYQQAKTLLQHSYEQKQLQLPPGDPDVFKSEILLGQLYYAMKEFGKAENILNAGINHFLHTDGDFLFWQADGYNTLALLADERGDIGNATTYYEKADQCYEASLQGEYDDIYLEFLRNAAMFYAQQLDAGKALTKANKGYKYVADNQGKETLLFFYQLINLSEIHYTLHHYKEAQKYSEQGLQVVNRIMRNSHNWLDSVKMELKKPKVLLLNAQSEYALLERKTDADLLPLLHQLQEALQLIEKRKALLQDEKDLSLLLADQSDLLKFIEKITLELYKLTGNTAYINQLMSFHESGIYNRIRSRLNKTDTVQFAHVPVAVRARENQLKNGLTSLQSTAGSHDEQMQHYLKAEEDWDHFLLELKSRHPKYYELKYASIFKTWQPNMSSLPANTTIIRYLFAGNQLVALVMDRQQRTAFLLDTTGLTQYIRLLSVNTMNAAQTGEVLYKLYNSLWKPLAGNIKASNVVIVPDGILYHLNFELLTPQKITRFEQLAANSLLARYAMSYQYSLLMPEQPVDAFPGNFIAFAPGFLDPLKENYRKAAGNSIYLDKNYLSLLPQPFTLDVASRNSRLLNGIVYTQGESTLQAFKEHAGHHKIIHIGTHAESNNITPQFSRLIFAKDTVNNQSENSLYLFDIYNCDLSSDLTVLTACESGKAGYEDGEGMISLAHAFNYAGSKSMLTGLWKIDEQASAQLADIFYDNLLKGMSKNKALQQAKLSYLATATGRMLAPQYWGGLILMGNTDPVMIQPSFFSRYKWVIVGAIGTCLLLIIIFICRYKPTADHVAAKPGSSK